MDETYIKVKGRWCYLYRAVDKHGKTLDFMLSENRDEAAATEFFSQTICNNGWPDRVVIEPALSAIDGMDGARFRHRNVPYWVSYKTVQ